MASSTVTVNESYTAPRTWTTGELVTKALLDAEIRDNIGALKTPASGYSIIDEAADYSTTSTSFVNIDGTDLSLTFTTAGGILLATFTGNAYTVATASRIYFDITVDGVRQGGDDGYIATELTTNSRAVCIVVPLYGVSAGSHTFALQWKTNTGTAGMYAGAGTASFDIHPRFFIYECA